MKTFSVEDSAKIAASRSVLEASATEVNPYEVLVCGLRFVVLPNVFSPKYFRSTETFAQQIPYLQGDTFLEMGCGTGVVSVMAALRGARKVLAVDINPTAVENTRTNASLHGISEFVEFKVSDIFSTVTRNERFNTIYWDTPFTFINETYSYRSMLERAIFDPGHNNARRFIREATHFLAPGGRILLGFGDFGDIHFIHAIAVDAGYEVAEIARSNGILAGVPIEFMLYQLTIRAS